MKTLYWLPRILAILAILFVSMFALDSFDSSFGLGQQILAFLIHLIPSFILIGMLILSWYRELWGGLLFIGIGVVVSPFLFIHNYHMNHSVWISISILLMLAFPFIVIGGLFLLDHTYRKKKKASTPSFIP